MLGRMFISYMFFFHSGVKPVRKSIYEDEGSCSIPPTMVLTDLAADDDIEDEISTMVFTEGKSRNLFLCWTF